MTARPQTPAEWRTHAEDLHRRGLEMIDNVSNMKDVPAEVAKVNALHAHSYFMAAQSAVAMATYLGSAHSPA